MEVDLLFLKFYYHLILDYVYYYKLLIMQNNYLKIKIQKFKKLLF